MPSKPKRGCSQPGCPNLVPTGRSYCEEHAAKQSREYDARRLSAAQRGYGSTWRKLREMVLADEPLCSDPFGVHADAGQTVVADEVDHIIPLQNGGRNIRSNLLPLCKSCHSRKTATEGRRRIRPAMVPCTVIAGPPGGGKLDFVMELCKWGDLVVDVDALFIALSGGLPRYEKPVNLLPFALEARDAVLARLGRKSDLRHAWVITSEGDRGKLEELKAALGCEVRVMAVSPIECIRRIADDERRNKNIDHWSDLVYTWWRKWEG
jgi:5-methylcytosine-specific restriction protein A